MKPELSAIREVNLALYRQCTFRGALGLEECVGLIWSDRVNLSNPGVFVVVVFVVVRGQSEQQSGQFSATIDQSDIRGSKPHNLDPSGAASDCYRESG